MFTRLLLATPPAFIGALAGLAMLRVLQTAFNVSFRERFTLGALVTFLVTVADVPIFNVGAPFWGLVIGYAVSRRITSYNVCYTKLLRRITFTPRTLDRRMSLVFRVE